ncbi:MAG: hypothetical protein R3C68_00620 [Myxococcota bacterium]
MGLRKLLLARYHMFLAVYYHHTALCFDYLLRRFYESGEYQLPGSSEAYLRTDDVDLLGVLRRSNNPWADMLIRRRPYRLLLESHDMHDMANHASLDDELRAAEADF